MEFKADALLLRAADYGENEKMVTLLTAARGKIGAAMKGVRKAGAKLNFASQPFCFAEYVLAERDGRYTVTQASLHDGFYGLRTDLTKYYAAASVLAAADRFSAENMPCGELLVAAVEALEAIETEDGHTMSALIAFLLRAVALAGYPVSAGDCPVCGKKIVGRCRFDMTSGAFTCDACAVGAPASESTYRLLRAFAAGAAPEEGDGALRALRLLNAYIAYQTDLPLAPLGDLIAIL